MGHVSCSICQTVDKTSPALKYFFADPGSCS
jgi:hypothetical protein